VADGGRGRVGLLGGTFFPISQARHPCQAHLPRPQAWFLRGLGDLRGGSISVVWLPTAAMLAFAAVAGGLALTRLKKTAEV
jgi:hypothetical protein